jgi:diguanylate cyclase (GGDEF)-like protein
MLRVATALAALLLALAAAHAAPAPARWAGWAETGFQHLTADQGLPNDIATAVAEDGQGYLWFGTSGGLARWDGYQFRSHKFDPARPGGLPDNLIQVLLGDAQGRLWIGTSGAGLVRYEPASQSFTTIGAGAQGLSHVSVRALADDGHGGLWVGTDAGLDHVDMASGRITRVPVHLGAGRPGVDQRVVALLVDRRGRVWAGTTSGLQRRDAAGAPFHVVPLPTTRRGPGAPARPEALLEDSAGRIWVGTARAGLFVLDADGSAAREVRETAVPAGSNPLAALRVLALLEVRPGEVWAGTLGQGIVAVDSASGRTRRLMHQLAVPSSLVDNAVRGLYRDRSGLVWVATHAGLSRVDPRAAAVLTINGTRPGSPVRSEFSTLMSARDGRVWLGTHSDGLEIVDPASGRMQTLRPRAATPEVALPTDVISGLLQVADGSVLVGTYRGLYRAQADGTRVARLSWRGRLATEGVGPMLDDGPRVWVGGLTDGLWSLDLASGQARAAIANPEAQLTDRRITAMARGAGGELWIGTRNGLNRYRPDSGEILHVGTGTPAEGGLAAGFVTALLLDRTQRLWVGTYGGGVHVLEATSAAAARPRFQRVARAEGLPDDNINALLEAPDGRVWASTENGLAAIDPATLRARAVRRAEGVVFQSYWTGSATRTGAGELLFGASGGLTLVRPEALPAWTHQPPVAATEIRIGGQTVPAPAPGVALQVQPQANSLSVQYAALDYSAPERNRYAHRLEGYDADWVVTDAQHRLATYANLAPGDYRLLVKGSNREGVFGDTLLTLPVQVLPAWHQTAWFRVLAALLLLAAVAAVVHLRTRVLQARRRELQRLVDERTAELQAVSRALEEKTRVLEHASICDPLTGLHNRRFLTEHIEAALAASQRRALDGAARGGSPVDTDTLFFLIDVDHFKRVNDELGHAAGDSVLVQLAQRLRAAMRESDDVIRWGGEEFLAVAHDTDRARADELAERIRASIAAAPFRVGAGRDVHITGSIGHAAWPFVLRQPQAVDWLGVVNLADVGLLAAKRLGRNAWVGVVSGAAARPEGLALRVQASPLQALKSGELKLTSSAAPKDAEAALASS